MLQQTQVSRVIEKYSAFIARFPTVSDLAHACEDEVLGMWSGLGYYRRARNLHAAARLIVRDHAGRVPSVVDALLTLPGVGRYTAGAIASIAFDEPAPIVDGNVARVLLRVHGKPVASDDPSVREWLWEQAQGLVEAAESPGVFNEGLMELGAMVCLPAPNRPKCEACPLSTHAHPSGVCRAQEEGSQSDIPLAKKRAERTSVECVTAVVVRSDGAVLLEQRPADGMWGSMWQPPTLEGIAKRHTKAALASHVGLHASDLKRLGSFEFVATHRRMVFTIYVVRVNTDFVSKCGRFVDSRERAGLAMGSPHARAIAMIERLA